MISCSKCGHENSDDSRFCAKCGNPISPAAGVPSERRSYATRHSERESCFGLPSIFWTLLIGLAIILWGISEVVRVYTRFEFPWWPIVIVIIGLFIISRALRRYL